MEQIVSFASRIYQDYHRLAKLLTIVAVASIYYISARLGLGLAFEQTNASPVWPTSGLAFAAILIFGNRIWPGIFIGAFLVNLWVFTEHSQVSISISVLTAFIVGMGNTLEAITGHFLLRKLTGKSALPGNVREVVYFTVVAAVMCGIGSAVGTMSLIFSGIASSDVLTMVWFTWWLGDTAGVVTITPLMLAWLRVLSQQKSPAWWRDLSIISVFNALITLCIFYELLLPEFFAFLPFIIGPFLLWAAYRCGMAGATLAIFIVSTIAVLGTINQLGAFTGHSTHLSLLLLQVFVTVMAISTIALAAAFEERNTMELTLRASNEQLEHRIEERTRALAASNKDLRDYQDKLEEIVSERTRLLELSNRELEAFCYSVSHDLRAPLRCIDGFSHLLNDEHRNNLDDAGVDYLDRIRHAAQRMGVLIDELLELSRVSMFEIRRRSVCFNSEIASIFQTLQDDQPGRKANLIVDGDIVLFADRQLLEIVFQNLIENAWKYSSGCTTTEIKIAMVRIANEQIVSVRDRGVGLDMKYVDKLFKPFQRLHGVEFEGSGVGLATVSRIVERHGGRVWVNSKVGEGSTFYFSLGNPHENQLNNANPAHVIENSPHNYQLFE